MPHGVTKERWKEVRADSKRCARKHLTRPEYFRWAICDLWPVRLLSEAVRRVHRFLVEAEDKAFRCEYFPSEARLHFRSEAAYQKWLDQHGPEWMKDESSRKP